MIVYLMLSIRTKHIMINAGMPTMNPTSQATPLRFPRFRVEPIHGMRLGTQVLESLWLK
jgi:hypothetical protein